MSLSNSEETISDPLILFKSIKEISICKSTGKDFILEARDAAFNFLREINISTNSSSDNRSYSYNINLT